MNVSIHVNNADLDQAFRNYIERRLRFALGRFGSRVGQVVFRLTADGQNQTRCRVSTEVLPFGRVAVEEIDPDLCSAVDRATGRLGRLFGRELERGRDARLGRDSVRFAA